MMIESASRSFAKAVSWRAVGSLTTAAIALALTRRLDLAVLAGGADAIAKVFLFYGHERFWNRVSFGKSRLPARVIWFTGLPGAGKTTLSLALKRELEARKLPVEHLDGDQIRTLFPETGFDRAARDQHIRRVGHLAARLESHDVWVLVAMVSPVREARDFARAQCQRFVEVHLNTPLEECERRDPKGLYRKARQGSITSMTGVQSPFEPPTSPELAIDTSHADVDACVKQLLKHVGLA